MCKFGLAMNQNGGKNYSEPRTMDNLLIKLEHLSADTGIPENELKGICLAYGLEALEKGELKISPKTLNPVNPQPFEPGATDSPE